MIASTSSRLGEQPACAFSSPLGAIHHASPEAQGASLRAVMSLFRRNRPAKADQVLPKAGSRFPSSPSARQAGLACTLERSTTFTVAYEASPLPAIDETEVEHRLAHSSPPPTYEAATGVVNGVEEDISIDDNGLVFIKTVGQMAMRVEMRVESPSERKHRERQERLERKRQRLIEEDLRLCETLDKLGF
ncbi:hypothetical protein BMF94_5644 [Rhodotorula taiwanensis]|uniref:Uncharacterized protein n=1 Tax=Rhodotorula taiwanensis TaxID=741276 RepID=A0A2S5B3G9_9BASI|nr:hypothetical protein BMF94_5644 [Rhodotorula taiwanensis]